MPPRPFDLPERVRALTWPMVVTDGDRDIRTPRAAAEALVVCIPGARLPVVRDHGRSALDTHPLLALQIMQLLIGLY